MTTDPCRTCGQPPTAHGDRCQQGVIDALDQGPILTPPRGGKITEADVWQHAARALARAAYTRRLRDSADGPLLPPLGPPLEAQDSDLETTR